MKFLKMALDADFLLFILGIFWLDIAGYIQNSIATCNPKIFGFVLAVVVYKIIKCIVSRRKHKSKK